MAEAVEVLTTVQPLLLVLEDLHWSDASTLAWLAFVARRCDKARLPVSRRMRLHQAISIPLDVGSGERAGDLPTALARPFERGQHYR